MADEQPTHDPQAAEEEEYFEEGDPYPDVPAADARHDNIPLLAKALDLHLMFPLVKFLEDRQVYEPRELLKAKLEMLEGTHMVDYAADIYKEYHGAEEAPAEYTARAE